MMKLWIGKNYMKGAIAVLLLCGSLLMTAGVLAYGSESPATLFGITPNPENILKPLGTFLGMETAVNMAASVATDKQDYHPGETVHITGSGFMAGETVRLQVVHYTPTEASLVAHAGHDPWDVTADSNGAFTAEWLVQEDSLNQFLLLTADGQSSGLHAETTFTDGSIGTYDQCSNDKGTGYTGSDPGCHWINGNLNSNNSLYQEGDATVQRAWLTGFTPGPHSVQFQYGTTKSGKHAYDYLTRWDWSEIWISPEDRCQDITGCLSASDVYGDMHDDPNLTNTIEPAAPGLRQFTMRGATFSSISTPMIEGAGTYADTSETVVTVNFIVPSSGPMCSTTGSTAGTCSVAIWFGAQVAKSEEWMAFNGTTGASTISGSPYHVALHMLDDAAIGNRDNQMQ